MGEDDRIHLAAAAQAVLSGERGDLRNQFPLHLSEPRRPSKLELPASPRSYPVRDPAPPELALWNGLGGFTRDGPAIFAASTTPPA